MKKETIVRTIMLFIGIINTICILMGWNPLDIDESIIYEIVSAVYMVAVTVWSWWKNNSFSHAAVSADNIKDAMQSGMSLIEAAEALTDRRDPEDKEADDGTENL